jgi:leucine efflux protein
MSELLGIHDYWTFISAVLVFLALPGPGTFCLLASTGRHGVRGGYVSLAGLILGDQMLMWLAVAGVAALLQAHPTVFHGLQYVGAAYLCYLGLILILPAKAGADVSAAVPFPGARDFARGLLVTLVNPKAIVFYMAFFPLFINPATHRGLSTFVAMALSIAVCTLLYCSLLIFAGSLLASRLGRLPRVTLMARRLAGMFLIGFGVKLTIG